MQSPWDVVVTEGNGMRGALIFDFDGVVIDTESAVLTAWRAECAELGVAFDEAAHLAAVGVPSLRPERVLAVLGGACGDPVEAIARIRGRLRELSDALAVLPGVRDVLTEAVACGVPLAVASGASRDWVHGHLERLGLRSAFAAVLCRDDVASGKPSPDLYLAALAALRVPSGEAAAIEDSATGLAAARAAGLRCVVVPGPTTVGHDLASADLRLQSLAGARLADLLPPAVSAGRVRGSAGSGSQCSARR